MGWAFTKVAANGKLFYQTKDQGCYYNGIKGGCQTRKTFNGPKIFITFAVHSCDNSHMVKTLNKQPGTYLNELSLSILAYFIGSSEHKLFKYLVISVKKVIQPTGDSLVHELEMCTGFVEGCASVNILRGWDAPGPLLLLTVRLRLGHG